MDFHFEDYALDVARRELRRGSELVPLEPQVFDLLVYVIQNRDRVVTKDDLIEAVWGGRIVSDSTLTTRINAMRRVLGDSGEEQRLIRTVARKGIRFVGIVKDGEAGEPAAPVDETPSTERPALTLPDKPSIAVLPFQNMSGDPGQEYFADGMVEEITTGLSRIRWLFVIARNSSFAYKGKSVDVKQIGRDLGVRYVLEGSVRKVKQRVRITAQLIDTANNTHLWADKFDGTLADIFALQDQITSSVVGILGPKLQQAEIDRASRKPTQSLDAYELYLKGLSHSHRRTELDTRRAYEFAKKATDLDPTFASALALMAFCQHLSVNNGYAPLEGDPRAECVRLVRMALRCDPSDPDIQALAGAMLGFHERDHAAGLALTGKALVLNPNSAFVHGWSGWVLLYVGDTVQARDRFQQAIRLSPLDPFIGSYRCGLGISYFFEKNLDEARAIFEAALQEVEWATTYRFLAATLAHLGLFDEARDKIERLLRIHPNSTVSFVGKPYRDEALVSYFREGLRMAGLPE